MGEIADLINGENFQQAILDVYDRCAICGFQFGDVLDAVYIVPIEQGGSSTYDNGLGLCPNCHLMFNKGLILVDERTGIHINPRYMEDCQRLGRAGSLDYLRETIRQFLWLPENENYHPSSENLRRTFSLKR